MRRRLSRSTSSPSPLGTLRLSVQAEPLVLPEGLASVAPRTEATPAPTQPQSVASRQAPLESNVTYLGDRLGGRSVQSLQLWEQYGTANAPDAREAERAALARTAVVGLLKQHAS